MKKVFLIMVILLTVAVSYAQPVEPMLSKGTRDIGISGSVDFEGSDGDVDVSLAGSYGYFFWDQIEIGGWLGWTSAAGYDRFGIGPYVEYNFKPLMERIVPYVGLFAGYAMKDADDVGDLNAFEGEVYGGIKYFITDITAIDIALAFDFASEDIYVNDSEADDTDLYLSFGIRTHF